MQKAFTLIELLVVVLIIGILSAIALPQYEKAVEKSRAAEALILLKHLHEIGKIYSLSNPGEGNVSFENLGVELPAGYKFTDSSEDGEVYCNNYWCVMTNSTAWGDYPYGNPDAPAMLRCNDYEGEDCLYGLQVLGGNDANYGRIICMNNDKWCKSLFGTSAGHVINM